MLEATAATQEQQQTVQASTILVQHLEATLLAQADLAVLLEAVQASTEQAAAVVAAVLQEAAAVSTAAVLQEAVLVAAAAVLELAAQDDRRLKNHCYEKVIIDIIGNSTILCRGTKHQRRY